MANLTGRVQRAWLGSMLVGLCWCAVALSGLHGCAGAPTAGEPGQRDILTDSDEPEGRKRARIRLQLAQEYFEKGQFTIALDEVKLALAAYPMSPEAFSLRALVYERLNEPRLAEESYQRALSLRPGEPNVLHNYAWMLCQQSRFNEASRYFKQAIEAPSYGARAKSWMLLGVCQIRAGDVNAAEHSLLKSYEMDAAHPMTAFNLASLLFQRGDYVRAQFYIRRLNNSEFANAETFWLGIKVEQKLGNREALEQLKSQLRKRFPQSRELGLMERGAFNE